MYRMFNEQRIVYKNNNVNRNLKSWYATLLNVLNSLELEYILHDFNNNVYYLSCISKRLRDHMYISGRIQCPFNQSCIIIECLKCVQLRIIRI